MPEGLNDKAGHVNLTVYVPPELVEIGVAGDLQRMFDAMIYKLRRNAHKGRWVDTGLDRAFAGLEAETGELRDAIANGSTTEILMEAADVANQALICANIGLEAKNVQSPPPHSVVRAALANSAPVPDAASGRTFVLCGDLHVPAAGVQS